MAGRAGHVRPSLITSARVGASLSTDQRAKRYVITMLFRVVCFIAGVASPMPWNWILFVAAALLPGIAVLLGNARDNRPGPTVPGTALEADAGRLAITGGEVVRGEVDEERGAQ